MVNVFYESSEINNQFQSNDLVISKGEVTSTADYDDHYSNIY